MTVAELAEVFQLGSSLARIETTLGHVATVGEKTNATVTDMQTVMGGMQVQLGQHGTILNNLVPRVTKLEEKDHDHSGLATKSELQEVKDEVKGSRLTWPKVATLIAAIVSGLVLAGIVDGWTPAN